LEAAPYGRRATGTPRAFEASNVLEKFAFLIQIKYSGLCPIAERSQSYSAAQLSDTVPNSLLIPLLAFAEIAPQHRLKPMTQKEARVSLAAEIDRIVSNAARAGSVVRTGYYAGMLAHTYADAGFSLGHIVDAIADAAGKRGVPCEIARPGQRQEDPQPSL